MKLSKKRSIRKKRSTRSTRKSIKRSTRSTRKPTRKSTRKPTRKLIRIKSTRKSVRKPVKRSIRIYKTILSGGGTKYAPDFEPYKCKKCNKGFSNIYKYEDHMLKHDLGKIKLPKLVKRSHKRSHKRLPKMELSYILNKKILSGGGNCMDIDCPDGMVINEDTCECSEMIRNPATGRMLQPHSKLARNLMAVDLKNGKSFNPKTKQWDYYHMNPMTKKLKKVYE